MRCGALVIIGVMAVLLSPAHRARGGDGAPPAAAGVPLSPAGEFVNTREGKAVVLPGTASQDGRYAVAWTIRANHNDSLKVDWSLWDAGNPGAILEHYRVRDAEKAGVDYIVRFMMVDFRSRRAGLLEQSWDPGSNAFPSRLDVLWCAGKDGTPYLLATRVIRGVKYVDLAWPAGNDMMDDNLTPRLEGGIGRIAADRRPALLLDKTQYAQYLPAPGKDGAARAREGAVEIPFHVGPVETGGAGAELLGFDGVVRFELAERFHPPHPASDTKVDDPFETDAELHAAYDDYERAYEAVADRYAKAGFDSLPDAFTRSENAWQVARTQSVIRAVEKAVSAGGDARAAEKQALLDALHVRTSQLKSPAEMKSQAEMREMLDAIRRVVPD